MFSEKGRLESFKWFVVWSRLLCFLTFIYIDKKVLQKLPEENFIIVANHASYLDIFLMHSVFPNYPFVFLGKSEILKYPIIGLYFKNLNIPVYRENKIKSAKTFLKAKKALEKGWSLVLFAEGKIPEVKQRPKMVPFKDGAFHLSRKTGKPIVCVSFVNNHKILADPLDFCSPTRPGKSKVIISRVISKEEVKKYSVEQLKNRCFSEIEKHLFAKQ